MARGLSNDTKQIIQHALTLWREEFEPRGIVPTVRQLFYQAAVAGLVDKDEKGYDRVQRVLARARERGDYPWEGIYDGLRQMHRPAAWSGLDAFVDVVRGAYRLDRWRLQPHRLEVWVEKDAVRGTVESVTEAYQVPLLCGRGYLSVTAKREASQRIAERPTTVIYIGDHDPRGVDMLVETEAWIRATVRPGASLVIERIAITDEDHSDPRLPHLPVNHRDARAAEYVRRFGPTVVEVEALSAVELQERVRCAIERNRDHAAWAEAEALEEEDQAELEEMLERRVA